MEPSTSFATLHDQYVLPNVHSSNPFVFSSIVAPAAPKIAYNPPPIAWPLDPASYGWPPSAPQAPGATGEFRPSMPVPHGADPLDGCHLGTGFLDFRSVHCFCIYSCNVLLSTSSPVSGASTRSAVSSDADFPDALDRGTVGSPAISCWSPGSQLPPNSSSSAGNNQNAAQLTGGPPGDPDDDPNKRKLDKKIDIKRKSQFQIDSAAHKAAMGQSRGNMKCVFERFEHGTDLTIKDWINQMETYFTIGQVPSEAFIGFKLIKIVPRHLNEIKQYQSIDYITFREKLVAVRTRSCKRLP